MDVFPSRRSSRLVGISNLGKWSAFEALMLQGRILAFIAFLDPGTSRVFNLEVKDWTRCKKYVDNFKRTLVESQRVNFFDPKVAWFKVARKLRPSPVNEKKNSDQRMNFKLDNIVVAKQLFSFGLRTVADDEGHVFQTSEAPMLIYRLTERGLRSEQRPSTVRRSFVEQDQFAYELFVLRPHGTFVVPPKTRYLILTVQKTLFTVDVMEWGEVKHLTDFRTHRSYTVSVYDLPPPSPTHPSMVTPEERRAKRARIDPPSPVASPPSPRRWPPPSPRLVSPVASPPSPPPVASPASPPPVSSPSSPPPPVASPSLPPPVASPSLPPPVASPSLPPPVVSPASPPPVASPSSPPPPPVASPSLPPQEPLENLLFLPTIFQVSDDFLPRLSIPETSGDDLDFDFPEAFEQFLSEFRQELGDFNDQPTRVSCGEPVVACLPDRSYDFGTVRGSSDVLPPSDDFPPRISNIDAEGGELLDLTLATDDRTMLSKKTHVF